MRLRAKCVRREMQKWDDRRKQKLRGRSCIFSSSKCEVNAAHSSHLQRHDRSNSTLPRRVNRGSRFFFEVLLRFLHERRARNCVVRMHAKDKSEKKRREKKKKYEQKNSGLRLEKVLEKVTRREARRCANARKKGNEGSATCIELRSDPLGAFFRRFCAIARCRARWTVIVFFFFSKRRNKECEKIIVARDGKRASFSRDLSFCDAR